MERNWINYSTHNTIIPNVKVCDIFIDDKGVKWIGSAAGLLSFNDSTLDTV
jgi:ligand-binding sensor domain-containing protein